MLHLRTWVAAGAATLAITLGGSILSGAAPAFADGPQVQTQMQMASMGGNMGMGMPMGMGMGRSFGFSGGGAYPMIGSIYGYGAPYAPSASYAPASAPRYVQSGGYQAGAQTVDLQPLCHQYGVGLQYGTMADNPTLDQACGTTGVSAGYTTPSGSYTTPSAGYDTPSASTPSQPADQPYP